MQLLDDTNIISDEIIKLHDKGLGTYVDKAKMETDGILHVRKCFSAFIKNDVKNVDPDIFKCVRDPKCDAEMYANNYYKTIDLTFKKVALQYHPQGKNLPLTAETNPTQSKNTINWKSPTGDYMNIILIHNFVHIIATDLKSSVRVFRMSLQYV